MRFRLTAPHYIKDQLLEAGTILSDGGEDTQEGDLPLYTSPTFDMVGLDKEAKAIVQAFLDRHGSLTDAFPLILEPQGADPGAMPVASPAATKGK